MRTANCPTCWIVLSFTFVTGVHAGGGGGLVGGGGGDEGGLAAVRLGAGAAAVELSALPMARKVASSRGRARSDGLMSLRTLVRTSAVVVLVCLYICTYFCVLAYGCSPERTRENGTCWSWRVVRPIYSAARLQNCGEVGTCMVSSSNNV